MIKRSRESLPIALSWSLLLLVAGGTGCDSRSPHAIVASPTEKASSQPTAAIPSTPVMVRHGSDVSHAVSSPVPSSTARQSFDIESPVEVESRLAADLSYLASDELGGRGPFTEGLEKAADHIACQFQSAGLETRRFGNPPFQVFRSTVKLAVGKDNRLRFHGASPSKEFLVDSHEFTPLSLSGSGEFAAPLAFVGHGIVCPELGLDDYANLDVRGHMLIVLRHGPQGIAELSPGRDKRKAGRFVEQTYLLTKVRHAIDRGAAGILLVTDSQHLPAAKDQETGAENPGTADPLLHFQVDGKLDRPSIPVIHCKRAPIDHVLTTHGHPTLAELERKLELASIAVTNSPEAPPASTEPLEPGTVEMMKASSFVLDGVRASGQLTIQRKTLTLKNVLAELPGRGRLADETILIGAHYDHLGMGGPASLAPWTKAVHNGADDNASGTAGLIEVARQLAQHQSTGDRRRFLFVAFSAEEMGLIGSERFVASPPVPLNSIVAMLNLDMVGRLRDKRLLVSGTGTASEFSSLVTRHAEAIGLRTRLDPSGYGPSDHATFATRGIPVLHFFTGLHQDYHRPSDDFEHIDLEGMRRIVTLVVASAKEISEAEQKPTPTGTGFDDLLADLVPRKRASESDNSGVRQSGSVPKSAGADAGVSRKQENNRSLAPTGSPKTRPGLGIEVENQQSGRVVIKRVLPSSVADAAGLRSGDLVRRVGGSDIRSVQELVRAVKDHSPQTSETLVIERGASRLEFSLVW